MNYKFSLFLLVGLMIFSSLFALSLGRIAIPIENVVATLLGNNPSEVENNIILTLRMPRILTALLVGAGLSIAGITYQGVFKNPLVSPDLLGVSAGASVGASVAILLGLGAFSIQSFAFADGILAVTFTILIPIFMRQNSMIILILSGIIVAGFMGATIGLLKYLADPETQLADIVYWSLGSLTKSNFNHLAAFAPVMLITAFALFLLRWRINLLSLGEQQAKLVGVNIKMERNLMILCSTLLTSSAVCLSGTIGWIGLVIPHLVRLLIGDNNVKSLPLATLIGAIFLLLIDTLARNLYTEEIPLGILTGFIGAPFFAWVLIKQWLVK